MPRSVFSEGYEKFRSALTAERKKTAMTQAVLAKRLQRPQSYVSKYELGERRLDVVEFFEVAAAIGFDPYRFLKKLDLN